MQAGLLVASVLAAALAVWVIHRGGPRRPVAEVGALAAVADALGLLTAELDGDGRIVRASPALGALGALPGTAAEATLGPDLTLLRRGAGRGVRAATAGRVAVPGRGVAQAAVVGGGRGVAVVLLRPLWRDEAPPPLPAPPRPPPSARPPDAAAAGRCLLPPIERAVTAAALLRLSLPARAAERELDQLERALAAAERRGRALAGGGAPRRANVDLAALVAGVLEETAAGAQASLPAHPVPVRADALRVRGALREILAAVSGARALTVTVRAGRRPALELAGGVGLGEEALALAEALLGPEGVEVAQGASADAGARRPLCRLTFPPAGPAQREMPPPVEVAAAAEALTPGRAGQ